jgi:hypothetical protein
MFPWSTKFAARRSGRKARAPRDRRAVQAALGLLRSARNDGLVSITTSPALGSLWPQARGSRRIDILAAALPARCLLRRTGACKGRLAQSAAMGSKRKRPPEGGRLKNRSMSRRSGSQHVARTLAAPGHADKTDPGETEAEHRPRGSFGNRKVKPLPESGRKSLVVNIPDIEVPGPGIEADLKMAKRAVKPRRSKGRAPNSG